MKWSETVTLTHPLRDVRLLQPASALDTEIRVRDAERAAFERGRREAEKKLGEQIIQQRGELIELQKGVLDSLERIVPQLIKETESTLIDLALESAKRVVGCLPVTAEMVEAVVREGISQVEDSAEITIHLNSDDLALLRMHQSPILHGLPETGSLRFISSSEVSRGGCLVQTRFGLLDARRETKFEQLRENLKV